MPRKSIKNKTISSKHQKTEISVRLYRRIAATFIVITACLFVFIIYLSFSKASIIIETDYEPVSIDFSVNVELDNTSIDSLTGEVISVVVKGELGDETTGTIEEGEGLARGRVTLINNTSNDQILIRTTRLLADNKLFRLDEKVTVPANGEIEARIYADEPGEDFVIESASFTIPGLWEPLQDKIYAESLGPTEISKNEVQIFSADDFNRITEELKNKLMEKGKEEIKLIMLDNWDSMEVTGEILVQEFDADIGEEVEKVNSEMELKVVGILFNKNELRNLAKKKLETSISNDVELVSIDYENMELEVSRYDLTEGEEMADLNIVISGNTVLKSNSQIFDKNRLIGLEKDDAIDYFNSFDSIKSVVIELKPFWLKRIPELRDHIEIRIKK